MDVIEDWDLSYALGNVVKYICRYRDKGGVTDLKKAQWYLNRYINSLTPNESIDVPKEGTKPYMPAANMSLFWRMWINDLPQ